MPYNTRRKSLSLSELGITVPKRSRAVSHPSPPSTIVEDEAEPPVKKSKRSHASPSPPSTSMSPPRTTTIRFKEPKESKQKPRAELSPPPSPAAEGSNKIDVEGINDDIVIGTIQQIEKTGNRPHLVKELAYVLATSLHSVEKSANPSALISSRLTQYLNRQWPAISPCPLAKDLSPVHPRRLYFYLTTTPHQPIPEVPEWEPPVPQKRVISPSLSSASAADEAEERYSRQRTVLSPSPEVDLSSPELDAETEQPPTPGGPFSGRNSVARDSRSSSLSHKRAASPQLEREERDFKQTASQLYEKEQLRRNSSLQDVKMEQDDAVAGAEQDDLNVNVSIEDTEESAALKHNDDAAALFGHDQHLTLPLAQHAMDLSSPVIQPQSGLRIETVASPAETVQHDEPVESMMIDSHKDLHLPELPDAAFAWDNLQSPEKVDVSELDDMFDAF